MEQEVTEDQIKDLASWFTGLKDFIWGNMLAEYLPVLMIPCPCDIYDNMNYVIECHPHQYYIELRKGAEFWDFYAGKCEHCSRNFLTVHGSYSYNENGARISMITIIPESLIREKLAIQMKAASTLQLSQIHDLLYPKLLINHHVDKGFELVLKQETCKDAK